MVLLAFLFSFENKLSYDKPVFQLSLKDALWGRSNPFYRYCKKNRCSHHAKVRFALTLNNDRINMRDDDQQYKIVCIVDNEIDAYLSQVVHKIAKALGISYKIPVYVISNQDSNAAVISSNVMIIHSGLILNCQNAEELIGVIAHEVGHIKGMHVLRRVRPNMSPVLMGVGLGLGMITGGAGFALMAAGIQIAHREQLKQMRDEEIQADTKAIEALKKLQWPSSGLVSFFKRLSHDISDPYASTHPTHHERIYLLVNHATNGELPKDIQENFMRIKAKLKGFLEKNTESDNSYERAVALLETKQYKKGIKVVEELLSQNPNDVHYTELQGDFYFAQGDMVNALQYYKKSCPIKYAHVLIEKKNADEAIIVLNSVLLKHENQALIWDLLSRAYAIKKQMGNVNQCLIERARIQGDVELMRLLLKKKIKPESKILGQRCIDIALQLS